MKRTKHTTGYKPSQLFRVHICGAGTDRERHNYSVLKDVNALDLAVRALRQMIDAWIPSNVHKAVDFKARFKFDLACALLSELDFDARKIRKLVDELKDRKKRWTLWEKYIRRE